jgi:hypothetical protein
MLLMAKGPRLKGSIPQLLALAAALVMSVRAQALETGIPAPAGITGTAVIAQNYLVGYIWKNDMSGTEYGPYAGLDFRQKLYESFMADLSLHVFTTSSSDNSVQLYLDRAEASYHNAWLTLAGGRRQVGDFTGPGQYLGSYLTMGERELDMVSVTLPFRLFADVPDADAQVSAPYNALSFAYIPDIFSTAKAPLDGSGGIVFAQLRVKFGVSGSSSDLTVNYSRGLEDYFQFSSLSEGGGLDASYAFSYKFAKLFVEFAVQDLAQSGTSVAMCGGSLNLSKVTFGLFESLEGEVQIPLNPSVDNPFTGGDPQDDALGQLPQYVWFVQLTKKTRHQPTEPMHFFYGAALTNSVGDYTLARLQEGTISVPVSPGFGAAPRVENLPLLSGSYTELSGLVYAGYEF